MKGTWESVILRVMHLDEILGIHIEFFVCILHVRLILFLAYSRKGRDVEYTVTRRATRKVMPFMSYRTVFRTGQSEQTTRNSFGNNLYDF